SDNEKQLIGYRQARLRGNTPVQPVQLMPQYDDLGFQPCLRLERRDHDVEEQPQKRDHCGSDYLIASLRPVDEVFGMDTWRPPRRSRGPRAPAARAGAEGEGQGAVSFCAS